ncbi:hypothetical protein [Paenibacillus hamazuiensis]|uniref:hypothetical protein n=1 Tax=Paenibacillus hamazuiensis TaxID=2936508 RepID=UPI00200D9768|nr:hypothetical protein [Paenibacillus hamazuiensis]
MTNLNLRAGMMILMMLGAVACSADREIHPDGMNAAGSEHHEHRPAYRPDIFPEETVIPFAESLGQPLDTASPPAGAKVVSNFALPGSEAEVLLYSNGDDSKSVSGYLKGRNSVWRLGEVSGFSDNQTWIAPLNFISGEIFGASLDIPFGPNGAKKGVLIYRRETDTWNVVDFQGHPAVQTDLDGDGVPEWVGNQTDWVPPALEIHRWAPEHKRFESTVLQWDASLFPGEDNETPSYSSLFMEDGTPFIEIGNDDAYAYFTYDRGVLKKYRPADTRDRVLEMQKARHH